MICSRAFCSESRHALRSCSVVLPPIKLTIARAAARQVSSMSICGMSARVLSVEPHIMATTAAAITTAFDIVELGIVLAEVPSSTELETILIMRLRRAPPSPFRPQHELSRGGLQCRDDTLNVETTSEGERLPGLILGEQWPSQLSDGGSGLLASSMSAFCKRSSVNVRFALKAWAD